MFMSKEGLYQIEELPDLKVGWDRAYKYQDVPLLDYVPTGHRRNRHGDGGGRFYRTSHILQQIF